MKSKAWTQLYLLGRDVDYSSPISPGNAEELIELCGDGRALIPLVAHPTSPHQPVKPPLVCIYAVLGQKGRNRIRCCPGWAWQDDSLNPTNCWYMAFHQAAAAGRRTLNLPEARLVVRRT